MLHHFEDGAVRQDVPRSAVAKELASAHSDLGAGVDGFREVKTADEGHSIYSGDESVGVNENVPLGSGVQSQGFRGHGQVHEPS